MILLIRSSNILKGFQDTGLGTVVFFVVNYSSDAIGLLLSWFIEEAYIHLKLAGFLFKLMYN